MYRYLPLGLVFLISACAFYPQVSEQQEYASQCELLTRWLELDSEKLDVLDSCSGIDGEAGLVCLAAIGIVVPTTTLLVSGSITVAGNTLHWLEYQGRCAESSLHKHLTAG